MTKNVTVFDSEGKIIGTTWPRRAEGLVKNGRARYKSGVETAIILARSPDIEDTDVSQEDEIMSNITIEELRAKIEEMVREARVKLDAVCKTASETIEDLVEKLEEKENDSEITVEFEEIEDYDDIDGADGADREIGVSEDGENGEEKMYRRLVRISDEDMEKLRAKMKSLRDSLIVAADEAKTVAVKAGAEIGRYAESVKAKVSEKLAERDAVSVDADAKTMRPGSEEYYLCKIEELRSDVDHFKSMDEVSYQLAQAIVNDASENSEGASPSEALSEVAGVAAMREERLRKTMEFYIEQVRDIRRRNDEAAQFAREDALRNSETDSERRARMIREDPMIERIMAHAAEANKEDPTAIHAATEYMQEYIRQTYGDNPNY